MKGKTVLITGSTGGIGKQIAISLARMGAIVVIHGRDRDSANSAVLEVKSISQSETVDCILSDISTIAGMKKLASEFKSKYQSLDVLVNNAGSAANEFKKTTDGFELNFAVNVLAPYLLSNYLLEYLVKSKDGRIITLTGGDLPGKIDLENLQCEKSFQGLNSYSQSKIVMMCLMVEYAKQISRTGVTCNICYPGQASTNMTRSVTKEMLPPLFRFLFPLFQKFVKPDNDKSAQKASRSTVYLASSGEWKGKTGLYCDKKMKLRPLPKAVRKEHYRNYIWNYILNFGEIK